MIFSYVLKTSLLFSTPVLLRLYKAKKIFDTIYLLSVCIYDLLYTIFYKRSSLLHFILIHLIALSGIFLVIYNEIEVLKDTSLTRGWGTYTMYGGAGALLLAAILSFIHVVFCHKPDRDKVDSLVLRTQRASWKEPKYQPTQQYLHSMGIDNNGFRMPPAYTANVYVRNHSNWMDR